MMEIDDALLEEARAYMAKMAHRSLVRRRGRRPRGVGFLQQFFVDALKAGDDALPDNTANETAPGAGVPAKTVPATVAAGPAGGVKPNQIMARLRAKREAQGLSLAELHQLTRLSQGRLSRLEDGLEPDPTLGTLERIAAALGMRLQVTLAAAADVAETDDAA